MESDDRFLDLLTRFAGRGVNLRSGNTTNDMIEHMLNSIEELEQNLKGVEMKLLKMRKDNGEA